MDSEKRSRFNEIWLKFLLFLNSAHVFPDDICECFNYDLYHSLEDYLMDQGPTPQAEEIANLLQAYILSRFLSKNKQLSAFLSNPLAAIKTHLVDPIVALRNSSSTIPVQQESMTMNQFYRNNEVNCQLPAPLSINRNYSDSKQQQEISSDTRQIIKQGFVPILTTPSHGDQDVPNQITVKVSVKSMGDKRVQIGNRLIANLGPSTSSQDQNWADDQQPRLRQMKRDCLAIPTPLTKLKKQDPRIRISNEKYQPIWLPSGNWPQTESDFLNEADSFMENLNGRNYNYVLLEEPTKRSYNTTVDLDERETDLTEKLANLEATIRTKGYSTSIEDKEKQKLKTDLKQVANTARDRVKRANQFEARKELCQMLQSMTKEYRTAMQEAIRSMKTTGNVPLGSKLKEVINAICEFVEKKRVKNQEVVVTNKIVENRYELQLISWKGECKWLEDLRDLLYRLISITKNLSTNSAGNITNTPKIEENEVNSAMSDDPDGLPNDFLEEDVDVAKVSHPLNIVEGDESYIVNSSVAEEQENKDFSEMMDRAVEENLQRERNPFPMSHSVPDTETED